jgi:hypothetical protein
MAKVLTLDADFTAQVKSLRDDEEKKWDEIAEITGIAVGKCMLAYAAATLPKKELIKNATAADIVNLRDERQLSWGQISVRCQLPESTCRTMYTQETGSTTKGLRIGKGGRHPGGTEPTEKPAKAAKATKATKAEAAPTKAVDLFEGMEEDAIKERLTGYAIKVADGAGGIEMLKIKAVKRAAKGKAVITTSEGDARTIKLAAVTSISTKKVA